ncbi:aminotransferase class IV family protein [Hoeflea poritis]|uniref:Probable branched-chain-amino-acid aminotransferase n=1 Tax=Hoeflea poritis TaxID=2993659 RepID=A0ABT4VQX7_9HYPH|nr:aminotransferase class IV family protein [Hoeflea poritis]MDA4847115.1 aminotransferase class IV family protein [Hoeflea poritis]
MTGPGLIETMRRRSGGKVDRLPLHLERLQGSAAALGIPCDRQELTAAIESLPSSDHEQRLRLELTPDGGLHVETHPCPASDPDKIWRLAVARTRLDSTEPLLRHKTTFRNIYVRARREFPTAEIDEILLRNERDELCEGTITSLFLQMRENEPLLTPALDCGLLRGVLRQELLDAGKAREAVLTLADLRAADRIYVGNSLRGLMPAALRA